MPYAMSVIISRAIPEIDGFKPSHRKLLYTMYKMGLLSGAKTKSSNVVGQTMKLNPHGDMAIYETMVRLTRGNEALLHPLVDSKGNFGKQYSRDMAFAAPRYTEVKLDSICEYIFYDINKNTVDFVDNYDSTTKEPVLLPAAFPNILVNPNQGIAVGMASNIASFNLKEVCEATMAYIKNPNCDVLDYMPAPDFSTGGILLYNKKEMEQIYKTGRGSFKLRAIYNYDKKNNCIEITQIPYTTTIEAIMDKIVDLVKSGKVREVADIRDETDLGGLKLVIDLKRGIDPKLFMTKLYKMTPLQDSFSCNFNLLIHSKPMVLGVSSILNEWVCFRINCIRRQIKFDLDEKSAKLHLLKGLKKILLDIDKAISIIRHTELESMVVPNLMKGFDIDKIQAEFVAEIKLRNLNKEYLLKRTEEIGKLTDEISNLRQILESDKAIKKIICDQIREVAKKYGKERKTKLVSENEVSHYTEEEFIEDYQLKLFLTNESYIKKISLASLRSSGSEHRLKEGDYIVQIEECSNKCELLLFSDKCNVYKTKVHELPDSKISVMGDYLSNLLNMEPNEKIIFIHPTTDYSGSFLFAYENGKMAKVPVSAYVTKTNRKRLTNAYYSKSPIIDIKFLSNEDLDLIAYSDLGKALCFNTSKIPLKTTKTTMGVQVMLSKKSSKLKMIKPALQSKIEDIEYYRTKNIPAMGSFLKEEDKPNKQISLF